MWILYDEYFQHFNRPVSPNLFIYNLQVFALISIWHRFTGIIMCISLFVYFVYLKLLLNLYYINIFEVISSLIFIKFISFIWVCYYFIFLYHFINGLRFIYYNFGFYYKN